MNKKISLALTPGAELGIGPALLIKSLFSHNYDDVEQFYWCLDKKSLQEAAFKVGADISFFDKNEARVFKNSVKFFDNFSHLPDIRQAQALNKSIELEKNNLIDAIVTGPINKSALTHLAPKNFPGQTEFFNHHLGKNNPLMTFMGGPFILSLFSTHIPLAQVSRSINAEKLYSHIQSVSKECARILKKKVSDLSIVLLGLNPHASENGLLGFEENEFFLPAINALKKKGIKISGPIAADGFFAFFHLLKKDKRPDLVIAMYHDQGLIPYKLLTKGAAVNVTLGLKIPRCSPAHGTGIDLSDINNACMNSTHEAIKTAIKLSRIN